MMLCSLVPASIFDAHAQPIHQAGRTTARPLCQTLGVKVMTTTSALLIVAIAGTIIWSFLFGGKLPELVGRNN
jgi:hypothetical protein